MSALIPPIFPLSPITYPAFPVHRRPTFATIYRESKQGRLTGAPQQLVPLWEFELTYEGLRDKTQNILGATGAHLANKRELTKILELFLCCASQYGEFLFLDATDNSRFNQFIASGDGTIVTFPFIRLIAGDTGVYFAEEVGAINMDFSVTIYVDSVEIPPGPGTWGVSEDQTSVVFSSPPALNALITSTFHYYYRCRWISDYQEVEEFVNYYWQAKSLRFRSIYKPPAYDPPQPIPPITPPNPPTPELTNCLKDFVWWNRTPSQTKITIPTIPGPQASAPGGERLDKHGHFWVYEGVLNLTVSHAKLDIFAQDGTVVASHTQADLADAIDLWYGSSIVVRTGTSPVVDTNGFTAKPIMGGDYVLAFLGHTPNIPGVHTFLNWWAVLDPKLDGSLEVVGACYYVSGLGPPYASYFNMLDASGSQSTSDALLFMGSFLVGGFTTCLGVLPSISEMSSPAGTYVDYPCRIPPTVLYPLGSLDLSDHLLAASSPTHGNWGGFILPNSSNDTILYIYINRLYMDLCAGSSLALADKEIKEVIQPVHPHGAMIKINLGSVDFDALSTTPLVDWPQWFGGPTPGYSIDNTNWKTSGGFTAIPFPDEYTYISLGNNVGGKDVYEMHPGAVVKRPNGKWWVLFYMSGVNDAIVNDGNRVLTSFRLFEWDPTTAIATQLVYDSCLLHTYNNINMPAAGAINYIQQDYFLTFEFVDELDGSVTIIVHGIVYKDRFYNFTPV
jgi:hypothetical protein